MNKYRDLKLVSNPVRDLSAQRMYKEVEQQAMSSCNYGHLLGKAKEVTKADPMFDKAYVLQGEIFISLNRYNDALNVLNQALEINPSNARALASKAYIYDVKFFGDKALEYCEKALEYSHGDYDLTMSLFDQKLSLLTRLNKNNAARRALDEASKALNLQDYDYLKECYEIDDSKVALVAL